MNSLMKKVCLLGAVLLASVQVSFGASISSQPVNITSGVVGTSFLAQAKESISYVIKSTVVTAGIHHATVTIESSSDLSNWKAEITTAPRSASLWSVSGELPLKSRKTYYRFRIVEFAGATGGLVITLSDNDDVVAVIKNNKNTDVWTLRDETLNIDGRLVVSKGIANIPRLFLDLATADEDIIVDITATTAAFISSGTTLLAANITQPAAGRNVVLVSTGEFSSTHTITGYATFYGTDTKGQVVTETIYFTTTTTVGIGNVALIYISSITFWGGATTDGNAKILNVLVGTGVKIGLANSIKAVTDVYSVLEAGTRTSPEVDAIYDTVSFVTAPNGSNDYEVISRADSPY